MGIAWRANGWWQWCCICCKCYQRQCLLSENIHARTHTLAKTHSPSLAHSDVGNKFQIIVIARNLWVFPHFFSLSLSLSLLLYLFLIRILFIILIPNCHIPVATKKLRKSFLYHRFQQNSHSYASNDDGDDGDTSRRKYYWRFQWHDSSSIGGKKNIKIKSTLKINTFYAKKVLKFEKASPCINDDHEDDDDSKKMKNVVDLAVWMCECHVCVCYSVKSANVNYEKLQIFFHSLWPIIAIIVNCTILGYVCQVYI